MLCEEAMKATRTTLTIASRHVRCGSSARPIQVSYLRAPGFNSTTPCWAASAQSHRQNHILVCRIEQQGARLKKTAKLCLCHFSASPENGQEPHKHKLNEPLERTEWRKEMADHKNTDDAEKEMKAINKQGHPWITDSQAQALKQQMRTTANQITMTRIAATPLLGYWIITDNNVWALAGCFLAGFSDWADGYIAKHYDQRTVLGTYLDPFADKVCIATLSIALAYKEILPPEVVAIWFTRDALLLGCSYYVVSKMTKDGEAVMDPSKTSLQAEPTTISKFNTALQFFTIGCGLSLPIFGLPDPDLLLKLR
jgi:phosphatidylglycerophosphate synthase